MRIVYETDLWLAVDKPAGLLSQKDKTGVPDVADVLKKEKNYPFLAPAHRLDRNTSGILLMAKSSKGASLLTGWIREGQVGKTYLAIVKGDPGEKGHYDFALEKDPENNQTFVSEDGKEAFTEFRRLQKMGNSALMEVRLHTGRSHQIRAHFAAAGHALIGDKKYAKKPWSEIFTRPALHAWQLALPPEAGLAKPLKAPPPEEFQALLKRLGGK